jgi:hypothetical protein
VVTTSFLALLLCPLLFFPGCDALIISFRLRCPPFIFWLLCPVHFYPGHGALFMYFLVVMPSSFLS